MQLSLNFLIGALIILLVAGIVIYGFYTTSNNPIKKLLGFGNQTSYSDDNIHKSSNKDKTYFYESFVSEVKRCSESKDSDCYCPLTNTLVPGSYSILLRNVANRAAILLYENPQLSDCTIENQEPIIQNSFPFTFYVENIYGEPSSDTYQFNNINYNKLKLNDFTIASDVLFNANEVCSNKDVKGRNYINFKDGILYKFNADIISLTRFQTNLRRCSFENSV